MPEQAPDPLIEDIESGGGLTIQTLLPATTWMVNQIKIG